MRTRLLIGSSLMALAVVAAAPHGRLVWAADEARPPADTPVRLHPGPQLLIDDYLVAQSTGVERVVMSPRRFLDAPIVTGAVQHQNWQPFLTVMHDATAPPQKRFRMWYNADAVDDPADGNFFGVSGHLDSPDGVHWPGPYTRLTTLPIDGRVRFNASVLDEGAGHAPPAERFKMMYFDAGERVGPRVAFSPDGIDWRPHDDGRPILPVTNSDDIWTAGFDPIRRRYFLIGKVYGPHTWTNAQGQRIDATIRRYHTSFSDDFRTWSEPVMVFSPDDKDPGVTQWYGAAGFQARGGLIIGFLRVLRDDLSPRGAPPEAIAANTRGPAGLGASGLGERGGSGMGYTMLTWTRDGVTWHRDRDGHGDGDRFFQPDPRVGAWDHAMAWIGSAAQVGDEVYLYYAGYRWGHKYHHSVDRQIGLVKMKRDRYVARRAAERGGTITTPVLALPAGRLTLNIDASGGEARVQVTDAAGRPLPGLMFDDCRPITTDALSAEVRWTAGRSLADVRDQPVRLRWRLKNASLYAFEVGQ